MASLTFKVAKYDVYIGRDFTFPRFPNVHYVAGIFCYGEDDEGKLNLGFLLPDSDRPGNSVDIRNKTGSSFLPAPHYLVYINLLQNNTKDIYVYLDDDNPSSIGLTTNPHLGQR